MALHTGMIERYIKNSALTNCEGTVDFYLVSIVYDLLRLRK